LPFSRPTLTQIAARVQTDIQGALEGAAAWFRRSFERGMGGAMTGASHELHGHMDWIAIQMDPNRADFDILQTVHGTPRGVYLKEPIAAKFSARDGGTDGTVVPAGTVYQRADDVRYTVDADATVAMGVVTLALTAETADAASNMADGTLLAIASPIAGITGTAEIVANTRAGTDQESQPDYLARVLQRMQNPPKGGAEGDFERWALESSANVTRAWEYPRREGAGTVTLYAVNDNVDPITLDAPTIAVIEDYCDQPGRQPVTMDLLVYTPTLQDVPLEINISPDTADIRAAIIVQLKAVFAAANPGGMTLKISKLNEAISIATGEDDHELVTPAANVTVPFGSMPVFDEDTIVWGAL
jgi:uncharacterized phage protein gp47/JayE